MEILNLCDEAPAFVSVNATAAEAIELMIRRDIGAVVVVDENGVVAGMFSERDVLRKLSLQQLDASVTPVRELMTKMVVMAAPETTPSEALAAMVTHHYRHLPIVDRDGRLLRVLSIRHVLEAKIDELTAQLRQAEIQSAGSGI